MVNKVLRYNFFLSASQVYSMSVAIGNMRSGMFALIVPWWSVMDSNWSFIVYAKSLLRRVSERSPAEKICTGVPTGKSVPSIALYNSKARASSRNKVRKKVSLNFLLLFCSTDICSMQIHPFATNKTIAQNKHPVQ